MAITSALAEKRLIDAYGTTPFIGRALEYVREAATTVGSGLLQAVAAFGAGAAENVVRGGTAIPGVRQGIDTTFGEGTTRDVIRQTERLGEAPERIAEIAGTEPLPQFVREGLEIGGGLVPVVQGARAVAALSRAGTSILLKGRPLAQAVSDTAIGASTLIAWNAGVEADSVYDTVRERGGSTRAAEMAHDITFKENIGLGAGSNLTQFLVYANPLARRSINTIRSLSSGTTEQRARAVAKLVGAQSLAAGANTIEEVIEDVIATRAVEGRETRLNDVITRFQNFTPEDTLAAAQIFGSTLLFGGALDRGLPFNQRPDTTDRLIAELQQRSPTIDFRGTPQERGEAVFKTVLEAAIRENKDTLSPSQVHVALDLYQQTHGLDALYRKNLHPGDDHEP